MCLTSTGKTCCRNGRYFAAGCTVLFSHRMMMTIVKIGMNRNQRLTALGIATLVSIPLFFVVDFIIPPIYLLLIAFIFILVFDLFIDQGATNFTWLVIWLVILSAFPSILLFRYNSFKDRLVRVAYAKELANTKDAIAEEAFGKLKKDIENNSFFEKSIPPYPFKLSKETLLKQVDGYYANQSYLYYNYTYSVYGFDRYGNSVIERQEKDKEAFDLEVESSEPTALEGLSFWTNDDGRNAYLMEVKIPENNVSLGFRFQRKRRINPKFIQNCSLTSRTKI